jgi:hypothetical protein
VPGFSRGREAVGVAVVIEDQRAFLDGPAVIRTGADQLDFLDIVLTHVAHVQVLRIVLVDREAVGVAHPEGEDLAHHATTGAGVGLRGVGVEPFVGGEVAVEGEPEQAALVEGAAEGAGGFGHAAERCEPVEPGGSDIEEQRAGRVARVVHAAGHRTRGVQVQGPALAGLVDDEEVIGKTRGRHALQMARRAPWPPSPGTPPVPYARSGRTGSHWVVQGGSQGGTAMTAGAHSKVPARRQSAVEASRSMFLISSTPPGISGNGSLGHSARARAAEEARTPPTTGGRCESRPEAPERAERRLRRVPVQGRRKAESMI